MIVLAALSVIGYLGYTYSAKYLSPPAATSFVFPTRNPTTMPTGPPKSTPTTGPPKTVTAGLNHASGSAFPKYTIQVPTSWTVDHKSTPSPPTDTLTITQTDYQVKIFQGALGKGLPCLYPGDPDVSGLSSRFTSYFQLSGQAGITYRGGIAVGTTGTVATQKLYSVCMKDAKSKLYGQPTMFGQISLSTPIAIDTNMQNQMGAMISSLKTP